MMIATNYQHYLQLLSDCVFQELARDVVCLVYLQVHSRKVKIGERITTSNV